MAVPASDIRRAIKEVRGILEDLERKLEPEASPVDPYVRRRQILQLIFWADGNMRRDELLALLKEFGTNYAWIGQQVRKGYLVVSKVAGGSRYQVTAKAVQEEGLTEEDEEIDAIAALSSEAFAEDWDNEEDSMYDSL